MLEFIDNAIAPAAQHRGKQANTQKGSERSARPMRITPKETAINNLEPARRHKQTRSEARHKRHTSQALIYHRITSPDLTKGHLAAWPAQCNKKKDFWSRDLPEGLPAAACLKDFQPHGLPEQQQRQQKTSGRETCLKDFWPQACQKDFWPRGLPQKEEGLLVARPA